MERLIRPLAAIGILMLIAGVSAQSITVYSGRNEAFIGPLVGSFEQATGIEVNVRYGGSAPLAAQILEEGRNSPADVFLAQDAGALGAVQASGLLAELSAGILERVDPRFRSGDGRWVGISGRARVLIVDPAVEDLPGSVFELTAERYRGRVGWAPGNGSFQAFVTAMRVLHGDAAAAEWLRGMVANDVQVYPNNSSQVEAVGRGEIDFGLVNHYYLYRFTADRPDFPAVNLFLPDADIGALVNVAGAAVLASSRNRDLAEQFIDFMLSPEAQRHFATEVNEYPLVEAVAANPELPPLASLQTPELDLSTLADLEGTLELLLDTGALE